MTEIGGLAELLDEEGRWLGEVEFPWPNIAAGDILTLDGDVVELGGLITLFPGSRVRAIAFIRASGDPSQEVETSIER